MKARPREPLTAARAARDRIGIGYLAPGGSNRRSLGSTNFDAPPGCPRRRPCLREHRNRASRVPHSNRTTRFNLSGDARRYFAVPDERTDSRPRVLTILPVAASECRANANRFEEQFGGRRPPPVTAATRRSFAAHPCVRQPGTSFHCAPCWFAPTYFRRALNDGAGRMWCLSGGKSRATLWSYAEPVGRPT